MHGEVDIGRQAGRSYLMLEGTDGQVHYVYYTPELESARAATAVCEPIRSCGFENCSLRATRRCRSTRLGDSESILRNKGYLRDTAQRLIRRGIVPQEDGWTGWLGRYQKAVREAATTLDGLPPLKETERKRSQDHGR